jgi:DNA mismatch endonuclease (patch repair protein)
MRKIKSKNTKPEMTLRKALWRRGYRYTLDNKQLPGRPDLIFRKYKVVVFVDGEFWHGYNWEQKKLKIKANRAARNWIY